MVAPKHPENEFCGFFVIFWHPWHPWGFGKKSSPKSHSESATVSSAAGILQGFIFPFWIDFKYFDIFNLFCNKEDIAKNHDIIKTDSCQLIWFLTPDIAKIHDIIKTEVLFSEFIIFLFYGSGSVRNFNWWVPKLYSNPQLPSTNLIVRFSTSIYQSIQKA